MLGFEAYSSELILKVHKNRSPSHNVRQRQRVQRSHQKRDRLHTSQSLLAHRNDQRAASRSLVQDLHIQGRDETKGGLFRREFNSRRVRFCRLA